MNFVFDVDGTLCAPMETITPRFREWFLEWSANHTVYLVSGSDYEKTVRQLGIEIVESVDGVFSCSGNVRYRNGEKIWQSDWQLPDEIQDYLEQQLVDSKYPVRTGTHIEHRPGACNFSVVGRDATLKERAAYHEWDEKHGERVKIANWINEQWPEVTAIIGGEISIDIVQAGSDKGQIARLLSPYVFFGDHCHIGGNDHAIAKKADIAFNVRRWQDTKKILKRIYQH